MIGIGLSAVLHHVERQSALRRPERNDIDIGKTSGASSTDWHNIGVSLQDVIVEEENTGLSIGVEYWSLRTIVRPIS